MPTQPSPGSPAPAFHNVPVVGGGYPPGATVSLADLKGHTVVLYFYPKDDTPGCTTQACALRDGWSELSSKAAVFGVSVDSVKRHEKFIQKHGLPFPLISDENHQLAEAYGVWVEKSLYGRKYMGTERTTFVIGPDGRIKTVLPKIQPTQHFEKLLAAL